MANGKSVAVPGDRRRQAVTQERWKQVQAVFEQALALSAEQRLAFLQSSCDGDEELRCEVQSLLDSHARAGSFIDERSLFVASDEGDERDAVVASGELIGSYRVVRELGRGGMGAVYLAERADEQYQKRVAIKLVKRGMDTDAVLRRFRNERQILASFDHANIARLFDAGTTATGLPYFVMEYVEGVSIDKYCDAHALSVADRLRLFREVCAAVAYAHHCGVIHRDIKSSNIVVTAERVPKLVDFGIAKILKPASGAETLLTTADLRPMTPQYASPEQVRGETLTAATDIYSLGVVLYELLTAQLPYHLVSRSPHDVARAITEQEPTRPSTAVAKGDGNSKFEIRNSRILRGDLDNIVLKALRKEPGGRYQSVEELSEDIRRHLEGRPIIARPIPASTRVWRWSRRNPVLATAASACLLLALAVAWLLREQFLMPRTPAPAKSIAVLPFENLSRDPDNAFFTNGVQDEILTALARIADLKVISRTSVAEYKSGIARDMGEIGQQLGVAHVLEGSVQRSDNHVRVNVQLVDARSDTHLWAQTYDRDLADVFAIQSEIAKAIATQLQAKLSVSEQTAIAQPPTKDVTAFLLYNRAKSLVVFTTMSTGEEQKFRDAIDLLSQAVTRDPSFFLAYCQLAYSHDQLYFLGFDHTPARLALAEAAIQAAFRLRPNAGEAHLARAENLYCGHADYDGALGELEIARRSLPNDPRIFDLTGAIHSHQGKYEESLRNLERALELDPRNMYILQRIAVRNGLLRRYAAEAAVLDRCLAIDPNDVDTRVARARLDLEWKADPRPLHQFIDSIRAENPAAVTTIADSWFACALAERDASAAEAALEALGENTFGNDAVKLSRTFGEGLIARMTKDDPGARAAFTAARAEQEKRMQAQPNYGPALCVLGLIDAGLGQKEQALREGRRAIELMPLEKDFTNGVQMIEYFAIIASLVGDKDLACEQLAIAARLPGYVSYGQLKLLPYWDPLRSDPHFEKIAASLAPK
ncbi:MAG: protein kinase domain-containing protein [Alphaproteobacteria bacterium]